MGGSNGIAFNLAGMCSVTDFERMKPLDQNLVVQGVTKWNGVTSAIGKQKISQKPTRPAFSFGCQRRDAGVIVNGSPGPGQYESHSSFGKQWCCRPHLGCTAPFYSLSGKLLP